VIRISTRNRPSARFDASKSGCRPVMARCAVGWFGGPVRTVVGRTPPLPARRNHRCVIGILPRSCSSPPVAPTTRRRLPPTRVLVRAPIPRM
jgi:hypothetical protein